MQCRQSVLALPALLLLSLALGGCASTVPVQPMTAGNADAAGGRGGTIALFQIKASLDGRRLNLAKPEYDTGFDNVFRFYVAGLGALEAPRRVHPVSPSESAAAEGWHYLVLPSGLHFLLVLPPGSEQAQVVYDAASAKFGRITENTQPWGPMAAARMSPKLGAWVWLEPTPRPSYRELPGFWFELPENKEVVYLGSLSIACRTQPGLLGRLFGPCDDFEWSSDPPSAQRVLAASLPRAIVEPLLLTLNGKPQPGTHLPGLSSVDVVTRRPDAIRATFLSADARFWVLHPSNLSDLPLWLLLYPLGAAIELSEQVSAEQRIASARPCIDGLSEVIRALDYSAPLIEAMRSAARASGTEVAFDSDRGSGSGQAIGGSRFRLSTSWPVLRLRDVGAGQAVLELAMLVNLEDVAARQTRYYSVIHYGHPQLQSPIAAGSTLLYGRFLSERPRARPMSDWCGPDGSSLLATEIKAVLRKMAEQVARDLE